MPDNFVHIMATAANGCIIVLFAHWLRNRNDEKKQATIVTPKSPLTTSDSEGIGVLCLIILLNKLQHWLVEECNKTMFNMINTGIWPAVVLTLLTVANSTFIVYKIVDVKKHK